MPEGRAAEQGVCFFTSLVIDFRPGLEAVTEGLLPGVLLDGEFASLRLSPLTSDGLIQTLP